MLKQYQALLFVTALLCAVIVSIIAINRSEQSSVPKTWSAFVYAGGYNSGRYQKTDDFKDFASCKAFAQAQATKEGEVNWECGLDCQFSNSRQGYHCKQLRNH